MTVRKIRRGERLIYEITSTPRSWCRSGRRNISPAAELYPLTAQIQAVAMCDYVLFNLVERLADRGVLNAMLTRKVAFWGPGVEETLFKSTLRRPESLMEGFPF